MNEKILKWLFDIQAAIVEIESFFKDYPLDFNLYKSNLILKRAVERDLEIIGEAVNRIIKQDENFPIENAKRIIGLRNQIIHAYDNISDDNIWAILVKHIPLLKQEINLLIENKNKF
ncbi:MAG TPA: HepT-like ribonuclease domain-containing protein [Draconibacterium sp.]|nr:HepT-like ribonuclease domain-containing protein [Draconibacterium sp.]